MRRFAIGLVVACVGLAGGCESKKNEGNSGPGVTRSEVLKKDFDHALFCKAVFGAADLEDIVGVKGIEAGATPRGMRPRKSSSCYAKRAKDGSETPELEVTLEVDCRAYTQNVEAFEANVRAQAKTERVRTIELGKGGLHADSSTTAAADYRTAFVHDQVTCGVSIRQRYLEVDRTEQLAAHVYRVLDVSNAPL